MLEKPTVLLIGNGPTALSALQSLAASFRIGGVFRGKSALSAQDPVQELAAALGVAVHPLRAKKDMAELVSTLQPAAVVISSYDRLLEPEVLSLSRFVNVHYSPLPRYRGRANVNWAVINGEANAAITIHMVVPRLDSGNILYQEEIAIGPQDSARSLYERLNAIQERELGRTVERMLAGDGGRVQDERRATYGCARVPSDGEIDWTADTMIIDRLVRALSPPFPGAFTYFEGQRLIILRAAPRLDAPVYDGRIPGRVVARSPDEGWIDVLTGNGMIRLLEVAPESGGACRPSILITSTRATLGLSNRDLLLRIKALEDRLTILSSQHCRCP
jgi:methionyl-tRNA formyltransferase